ncbi:hypothetical protein M153_100074148 [Pseudoloma neurophilia]|uniref:Uncharacterized protein n=1 Tax=Pseudoloma neurophilia TaxID=146866 RepID=A0A0R0M8X0_9MICR|nr:hypothetical protein M153_100074148 [Pseudoloma neurophilia]
MFVFNFLLFFLTFNTTEILKNNQNKKSNYKIHLNERSSELKSAITQKLFDLRPSNSRIRIESKQTGAHIVKYRLPKEASPCLEDIKVTHRYHYDQNVIFFYLNGPSVIEFTILKQLQPVFYLMANIDMGLLLFEPEIVQNDDINDLSTGNTVSELRDCIYLSDVSFPFVSFVVITITTFFFLQYQVTQFFAEEENK